MNKLFSLYQSIHSIKLNAKRISCLLGLLILLLFGVTMTSAQSSAEELHKFLQRHANFVSEDFALLEREQVVVKTLPAKDKREVGVIGIVRLKTSTEQFIKYFRDSVSSNTNKAVLQIGKFSNPPTLHDLQVLTIENRDVEDMPKCEVGNCNIKLSSEMIERVRSEVNWSTPGYHPQATELYRQMLLVYVQDYLARGNVALIEYHDKKRPVRLEDEVLELVDASSYLGEFAPDLIEYLKAFPSSKLPVTESFIYWSKAKSGLKPVITITHTTIYQKRQNKSSSVLIASKQIYANHYFDSSLGLSVFLTFQLTPETSLSYLLYLNRSRADALGGTFGNLGRSVTEDEALKGLNENLQLAKLRLEKTQEDQSTQQPESQPYFPLSSRNLLILLAILGLTLGTLFLLLWQRRKPKRTFD